MSFHTCRNLQGHQNSPRWREQKPKQQTNQINQDGYMDSWMDVKRSPPPKKNKKRWFMLIPTLRENGWAFLFLHFNPLSLPRHLGDLHRVDGGKNVSCVSWLRWTLAAMSLSWFRWLDSPWVFETVAAWLATWVYNEITTNPWGKRPMVWKTEGISLENYETWCLRSKEI